jgi:hypothetical protein
MQDNPSEALSMEELVLRIQKGEEDPLLLPRDIVLKIVQYAKTDPDGQWKNSKIAGLIRKKPRSVIRYWKEVQKRQTKVVDRDWLKERMSELFFESNRQYERLNRLSYSADLSDGTKGKMIASAIGSLMKLYEQMRKQYFDREQLAEETAAEEKIQAQEEEKKQREDDLRPKNLILREMENLAPIDRTTLGKDLGRAIRMEQECCFKYEDFKNEDQIQELLEAIKKDELGLVFDGADNPINQINSVLAAVNFHKVCLEKKLIEHNHPDIANHDRLSSLLDRAVKGDIAEKEYSLLGLSETSDLFELNRLLLKRIYKEKCPNRKMG